MFLASFSRFRIFSNLNIRPILVFGWVDTFSLNLCFLSKIFYRKERMCFVFYLPVFVPALPLDCRAMVFGKRWLHQYQLRRLLTPGYSGFCSTVHAGFTPGLSGSSIFVLSCLFQSPFDLILRPFPPFV